MFDKQRAVIEFLRLEGESGDNIHTRLVKVYGADAYSRASVYNWVAEIDRGRKSLKDLPRSGRTPLEGLTEQLEALLQDWPFHTTRTLADETKVSHETVRSYLEKMGLKYYVLRWIPHHLNSEQKKKRVDLCSQMLIVLKHHQRKNWVHLVTGDQSWFYFKYIPNGMWTASHSSVLDYEKPSIQTEKYMFTIFWNPHGFHVIEMLDADVSFNAHYMVNTILTKLISNLYVDGRVQGGTRLTIHMDNAKPHNAKVTIQFIEDNRMKRLPHPAYSPDIAPSDFYLFGNVKRKLEGLMAETPEELFDNVISILLEIPLEELHRVFNEWVRRVEAVIDANGDYIE
jgi:transposase